MILHVSNFNFLLDYFVFPLYVVFPKREDSVSKVQKATVQMLKSLSRVVYEVLEMGVGYFLYQHVSVTRESAEIKFTIYFNLNGVLICTLAKHILAK